MAGSRSAAVARSANRKPHDDCATEVTYSRRQDLASAAHDERDRLERLAALNELLTR